MADYSESHLLEEYVPGWLSLRGYRTVSAYLSRSGDESADSEKQTERLWDNPPEEPNTQTGRQGYHFP